MVLNPVLHEWIRKYEKDDKFVIYPDHPDVRYLLGFEEDHVEPLPIKTYIRRLWLAFQSGKNLSPRYFFNSDAEKLSQEIGNWVSSYVGDSDRLVVELEKSRIYDIETGITRNGFLEEAARWLLFDREYGEILWGNKRNMAYPLQNTKPEREGEQPPKWPQDQDLIILTVRQWMAARLQHRLQESSLKKIIPRVNCPENPQQEREGARLAIELGELTRDDQSEDDPEERVEQASVGEAAITTKAPHRGARTRQGREDNLPTPETEGSLRTSTLRSRRPGRTHQEQEDNRPTTETEGSLQPLALRSHRSGRAYVVRGAACEDVRPPSKRKLTELMSPRKRSKTASQAVISTTLPNTPPSSIRTTEVPLVEESNSVYERSRAPSIDLVGHEDLDACDNAPLELTAPVPQSLAQSLGQAKSRPGSQDQATVSPLQRGPTLQKDQTIGMISYHIESVTQDLDIDFDQLGDPAADDSLHNISQDEVPDIVTPGGYLVPGQSQEQHETLHAVSNSEDSMLFGNQETHPTGFGGHLETYVSPIGRSQVNLATSIGPTTQSDERTKNFEVNEQTTKPNSDQHPWGPALATPSQLNSTDLYRGVEMHWSPESDARQRIATLFKNLIAQRLTYDSVLDDLIPRTQGLYRMRSQRTEDKDHRSVYRLRIKMLGRWETLLKVLKRDGYIGPDTPEISTLHAILEQMSQYGRPVWLAKLENLEGWFHSTISSWNAGETRELPVLSHDLAAIYREIFEGDLASLDPEGKMFEVIKSYNKGLWRIFTVRTLISDHFRACDPTRPGYDPEIQAFFSSSYSV